MSSAYIDAQLSLTWTQADADGTRCTATGWATPDQIASRIDRRRALKNLQLSMVGAVNIAHIAREVAATHSTLTAPARATAMRAQGEAEIARTQGITAYDGGKTSTSASQIATNQAIILPDPARRGLVNLANDVIARCNRTVAAAAPLDLPESAQPRGSMRPEAPRRSGQSRTMPRRERPSRGPRR